MSTVLDSIPSFDITVKAESLQDDLFEVYKLLFKDTNRDDVEFEELQGGYINSIFRISPKKEKNKSLVFRTFGMKFNAGQFTKTINDSAAEAAEKAKEERVKNGDDNNNLAEKPDQLKADAQATPETAAEAPPEAPDFEKLLFSRMTEYLVMNEVSKHGLCGKVYGRYQNGIVYGFAQGVTLNGALMLTHDFLNEAATKMAKFHSIKYEVPGIPFKTHYDRVYDQMGVAFAGMLQTVDEKLALIDEFPYNELPRSTKLVEYEERMKKVLTGLGFGRICFAHNDCNQKNLIWSAQDRTLSFIDFEMTMNNYSIFDLGYLFGCYPGHFLYSFDKSFFPNPSYRRSFLKKYLEEFNKAEGIKQSEEEFQVELEDLYHKVNLTTLMHLVRLSMIGGFFDFNPSMFKNEELRVSRENDKYFCGKYSYKVFKLFEENYESITQEAEKYLESKNKTKKTEA